MAEKADVIKGWYLVKLNEECSSVYVTLKNTVKVMFLLTIPSTVL